MRLFLRRFSASAGLQLVALLYGAIAGTAMSQAATLVVTSGADSGAGSLRQALADANNGDTIQFDAALNGQTVTLTSDELVIDSDITINGPGPDLLTVEKTHSLPPYFRIFHVMPNRTVIIEGLTISNGNASGSFGGGILNDDDATLTISNCDVFGNVSDGGAGGGGIYNRTGMLTIIDSIVSSNWAGFTFGTPLGFGGGISSSGTLTILNSAVTNNMAAFYAGGIAGNGTMTIINSTISGNWAGSSFEGSGRGGGIYSTGTLEIRNSTVSGNTASGTKNSGIGGGIVSGGSLTITNSTISGNLANQDGGGILNDAPLTITNSTVSDNRANRNGGGIYNSSVGTLDIGNTILSAGVSGANLFSNGGSVTSRGYNLSSDNGGAFLTTIGDQINTDPLLGPLQDNGGPTFTHNLLTGSPGINAGDPSFTPPPDTDQRGYDRVFDGRIDIGSLEVQPTPTPGPSPTPTPTPTATATATPITTPTATSTPSPTATATPAPTSTPGSSPARALNISTRLRVETGDNVMIGGFIITGNASKSVAVRGIGPSLAGSGLSDVLADPTLELRAANGALILQDDDWQDDPEQAAQLSALGLAPLDPKESGIIATLSPNTYTAILAGKNNSSGIGLVEVYDTNQGADSQLANISTRGFVQTGSNVMIGGFILGGSSNNTGIIVRGLGPSLAQFGLSPLLADPTLELHDGNGTLLISNDDWQNDPMQAAQLNAHGLGLQDPKESGIYASLPPGTFTAILAGKNGSTGIGLVEIYNVQ